MKKFYLIPLAAIIALPLTQSCNTIHQFPEEGKEVDPTTVSTVITVKAKNGFEGRTVISKAGAAIDVTKETADKYDRRYFIKLQNSEFNDETVEDWCIFQPAADTAEVIVDTICLHARKYKITVWMDYVLKEDHKDLYFKTGEGSSLSSVQVLGMEEYVAGSDFKDGQHKIVDIDLTSHAGEWYSSARIPVQLESKMAKIRLLGNDLDKYAQTCGWKYGLDSLAKTMRIEFTYNGYFPTGFNVWTGRLNDAQTGYGFYHKAYYPQVFEGQEYTLVGSDYVFVNGESSSVNISAVIYDKDGNCVNIVSSVNVPIKRGQETVVIYKFFTREYVPGIGINPEFDGEFNVYV